ncbi:unnamed protein product, partial [Heterobilharzia americana]
VGVVEFEGEQVEGVPPLWCAAASGHLKLVELLVSRGADVIVQQLQIQQHFVLHVLMVMN